jgi:hypothetical protein
MRGASVRDGFARRRLVSPLLALLVFTISACSSPRPPAPRGCAASAEVAGGGCIAVAARQWRYREYAIQSVVDSAISSSTVHELSVASEFGVRGVSQFGALATTPLVVDGVAYFEDLQSNV